MTPCTTDPILAFSNRNLDLFYRDGYSKNKFRPFILHRCCERHACRSCLPDQAAIREGKIQAMHPIGPETHRAFRVGFIISQTVQAFAARLNDANLSRACAFAPLPSPPPPPPPPLPSPPLLPSCRILLRAFLTSFSACRHRRHVWLRVRHRALRDHQRQRRAPQPCYHCCVSRRAPH
jgi:hypothetical protein